MKKLPSILIREEEDIDGSPESFAITVRVCSVSTSASKSPPTETSPVSGLTANLLQPLVQKYLITLPSPVSMS